jgi:Na+:H+ antiporter, NhaA family
VSTRPDPTPKAPTPRWLRRVRLPLERFLRLEAASGILLLLAAAVALLWAGSAWGQHYVALWHKPRVFERSLAWFVDDVLMVVFFFVVGLEIRRELYCGELSEWRRAALPALAALGGMVAPAAIYLLLADRPELRAGWGVPMATDIAFAVGVLTLLGRRVPPALRVLLLALAVIDDLGAILVIALFYSSGVALSGLAVALAGVAGVWLMQRGGVRAPLVYTLPAALVWAGVYAAGVHPTIAGVVVGLLTPVRVAHGDTQSPAERLIAQLHPWVAYGIMPLFALANAGVSVSIAGLDAASWQVVAGVALGLVLGKPVGVLLAIGLTLRLGVGVLPRGIHLRHLVVLGLVAGIGFTMALFVAQLAFVDAQLLAAAKVGVLCASAAAALLSLALGWWVLEPVRATGAARSADEAERSTEL